MESRALLAHRKEVRDLLHAEIPCWEGYFDSGDDSGKYRSISMCTNTAQIVTDNNDARGIHLFARWIGKNNRFLQRLQAVKLCARDNTTIAKNPVYAQSNNK